MKTDITKLREAIAYVVPADKLAPLQGGPLVKAAAAAFWVWTELELTAIPDWVTDAISDGVILGKGGFLDNHVL